MRLFVDPPMTGAQNMARDEALLKEAVPTVRLYGWRPACVSLGRAQTEADVDLDAARAWGLDLVQRPTGGGAILHNEAEVTYAVVLPFDFPGLPRDVPGSFAFLSAGVVAGLRALGLDAQIESVVDDRQKEALCYVRRQGTNIVVGGRGGLGPPARKISGGAQRRDGNAVLQHGTIIVDRDEERMATLFRTPINEIRARVTSLSEEGVTVSREKLVEVVAAGFRRSLSATSK